LIKFLIFSLFFHLLLITFFNVEKFDNKTKYNRVINVSYVENKKVKKETTSKTNKSLKEKKNKPKKKQNKKSVKKNLDKKPTITKKKKDAEKKTLKKINNNRFDDMLKNLAEKDILQNTEDENNINKKIENLSKKNIDTQSINTNKKELNTIVNILMTQINNNWTRPPGIKNIENLTIKISITLDPYGNVTSINIPSSTNRKIRDDKFLRPYLDSAIRAIKKSSPFEGLEKHRYNIWKKININFMPFEANQ
tara:strand:+ start:612 stop:1364 length:753 start_codon:yes stop_codon:yes gene_type:complete